MKKLLSSAAFAAAVTLAGATAQAFPALTPSGPAAVIQVRNLCGLGWHRGPYGLCHPNGVYPYVYGPYGAYAQPYYAGRCWWTETAYGPRRVCTW